MGGRIGWTEVILIVIVALLIFGPKKLPEIARSIGTAINEFKQTMSSATQHNQVGADGKELKAGTDGDKKNEDKPVG
jgi:TatA/E family protein of Tat protein translocase